MFEGVPSYPNPDRFWNVVAKYKVNVFYTAPTAIRAIARDGDEWPAKNDLSSLRLLGSVGEPINPEAWMWYYKNIGKERCPIVDTWWQTETGGILITPLPGAFPLKPGSATLPFPGIFPEVVREDGKPCERNEGGYLVIKKPWPGQLRTIWGDDKRYADAYYSRFKGVYFTGDGARQDEDGYFWLMGRVDDVINVSGHRIGTMEVESALVSHESVAEAAVVPMPHEIKGEGLYAFVTLTGGFEKIGQAQRGAPQPRQQDDRADREAGQDPVRRRAPEDAERQDHEANPQGHRDGQHRGRRHDDAGRSARRRRISSTSASKRLH